jgi:2-iminobutanoate/2-iminopropanoate deaminase
VTDVGPIRVHPDPYEPYRLSQGFRVGDLLLISGQAAIDEAGGLVGVGDFDAQAEQVFRNLQRVLEAGGSSLERVVKVTIFLTDMANFPRIVELRGKWFTPPYPADTIVEVTSLALPELEIEIEAIAVAGSSARRALLEDVEWDERRDERVRDVDDL